jgi:thiol-disulfide isomerase/thioredoxin
MMMRALIAVALSTLLLTSCGDEVTPVAIGEVISCESIEVLKPKSQSQSASECLDGGTGVDVRNIKGPAIINVWGSWCGPCKEEIPYFVEFYETLDPSIQLIGVDVEEASIEDGRAFVIENGITWPNLFDSDSSTDSYFGMGVPVTWFIGTDGEVLYKKIGVINSADELRELSEKYLGAS